MKFKLLIALITINLILIAASGMDKGKMFFFTTPLILLINLISGIYGFSKTNKKFGITALILFFTAPITGFIIFINVFPFLTR